MNTIYRFHVEGHLDQSWASWLSEPHMQYRDDGTTIFIQSIPDQAALYGVLLRLSNSGVSLIDARRMPDADGIASEQHPDIEHQHREETMLPDTAVSGNITDDAIAIRSIVAAVEAGWNAGSGDQFAAPFAIDADYVVVNGMYLKGRQAIAAGHQHIFETIYRDSRNTGTVERIRFLTDDVALTHVRWHLKLRPNDSGSTARCTMVLTRSAGDWTITAFHNTPVVPRTH